MPHVSSTFFTSKTGLLFCKKKGNKNDEPRIARGAPQERYFGKPTKTIRLRSRPQLETLG